MAIADKRTAATWKPEHVSKWLSVLPAFQKQTDNRHVIGSGYQTGGSHGIMMQRPRRAKNHHAPAKSISDFRHVPLLSLFSRDYLSGD
jgi:hypothetical protein